jgi:hypothetical protein
VLARPLDKEGVTGLASLSLRNKIPSCTAKTQYRKYKYSQKRNCGASVPISTYMCLWAIYSLYSHNRPAYSAAGKYVDRSWEYINRSQTHECGNWDWGRAIPFLGIHKWDFAVVCMRFSWSVLLQYMHLWTKDLLDCFCSLLIVSTVQYSSLVQFSHWTMYEYKMRKRVQCIVEPPTVKQRLYNVSVFPHNE